MSIDSCLYSLGLDFLHRNLLFSVLPHLVHEHGIEVWDICSQNDSMRGKGLILHFNRHITELPLSPDLSHLRQVLPKQVLLLEKDVSFI